MYADWEVRKTIFVSRYHDHLCRKCRKESMLKILEQISDYSKVTG